MNVVIQENVVVKGKPLLRQTYIDYKSKMDPRLSAIDSNREMGICGVDIHVNTVKRRLWESTPTSEEVTAYCNIAQETCTMG